MFPLMFHTLLWCFSFCLMDILDKEEMLAGSETTSVYMNFDLN